MADIIQSDRHPNDRFLGAVSDVLLGIRRAIETPMMYRWREENGSSESARRAILAVESARIPLRSAMRRPEKEFQPAAARLLAELRDLQMHADFVRVSGARFRPIFSGESVQKRQREYPFDPNMFEGNPLAEVVGWLINRIEAELGLAQGESAELDFVQLRKILPTQKVAPAQFDISENRLVLIRAKSNPDTEDASNVTLALEELVSRGATILSEIQRSNCDRRLLDTFQYLQAQLASDENVIKIGLSNLHCEVMCTQFMGELPDALAAMLRAHTRNVDMYAAQFPEWNRFVENASTSHISSADIDQIRDAADALVGELKAKPELAEPEVPQTVLHLNELLRKPGASVRRAAFAMLRTLENLISRVYGFAADLVQATLSKTIEATSTALSRTAAAGLLSLAIYSAGMLQPVAGKITEMQWLKSATDILQKQIEALKLK